MKLQHKLLHVLLPLLFVPFLLGADPLGLNSYPQEKIMGFRGLDTRSSSPLIADSRASDLKNVSLSSALDLRRRYGMDTVNNATLDDLDLSNPPITGIFDSEYSDATSNTIVFIGKKIKYDNSGSWTEIGNYWVSPTVTAGKNLQWQCLMAFDSAVCTNDSDVPLKISKTPAKSVLDVSDLSDTLTKVKVMVWYRNYLILGNTFENSVERPTRFRWSNVGTIETYTDDDFVDISTFAGDEIVGFVELYGDLYIFLKKSIWKASLVGGDEIFVFTKIIDGVGAIARDSIKVFQLTDNRSVAAFLDQRKKVFMFDGVSVIDIGSLIQPTLDGFNESRMPYAVSTFDGENYILSVSTGSLTTHNTVYIFNTEIFEWTVYDQIDANALAQVKESDGKIKTYVGNYSSFVYWLDNPDNKNDIDGAVGIVDSVGALTISTQTHAQAIIDAALAAGEYTGAIVRITSGTGVGQERLIIHHTDTSLYVATDFTTSLDTTSVYSIGDIDAFYQTKFYDMGNSNREKSFLGMLMWAEEASSNEVDVSYGVDFGESIGSENKTLAPSASSLWDTALWDVGVWGTTGDKLYTVKMSGFGNTINVRFENNDIDETFHIYGFNLLAIDGDTKQ